MNQLVCTLIVVAMISGCASRSKEAEAPKKEPGLALNLLPDSAPARVIPQEEAEEEEAKQAPAKNAPPGKTALPVEGAEASHASDVSVQLITKDGRKKHAIEIDSSKIMAPTGPVYPDSDSNTINDVQVRMGVPGEEYGGVEPAKSLRWLKNGNARFVKRNLRNDGQSAKDVARLARDGQKPHAIVLACADSFAPPELVFDQKLGELFVLRNSGPSLDDGTIRSIEYAVEKLGARLLVVMGHGACSSPESRLPASEVWLHVRALAKGISERSSSLETATRGGKLSIVTSVYDVTSGRVDFE